MTLFDHPSLTLEEAHRCLKQFDCIQPHEVERSTWAEVQQALRFVASRSDYQILGICADTVAQAKAALESYAQALGYDALCELEPIEGSVYLKFNPKTGTCHLSPYPGSHRGVLVACQSTYETGINEMYGHLPLELFLGNG